MKQKELSIWLRVITAAAGVCCALLAFVIVPSVGCRAAERMPEFSGLFWPCLIFFWVSVVPVAWALVLAWRIFARIGRDRSFCMENAAALRSISRLAALDTALYVAAAVVMALNGLGTEILLLIFLGVVFIGICVCICCAALSHLTRKAAEMQSENDLTI